MAEFIKKFTQNRIFYVCMALLLSFMPVYVNEHAEAEKRAIVTFLGVDKTEDGMLELSANVIVPKNASEVNANLAFVSAKAKTIYEAKFALSVQLGKRIGMAHCEMVLMGKDLFTEDVATYLDFFIRTNNLTTNSILLFTNGKAKDVLEAITNNNSPYSNSLKNLIVYDDNFLFSYKTNVKNFYKAYYSPEAVSLLAVIDTKQDEKQSTENKFGSDVIKQSSSSTDNDLGIGVTVGQNVGQDPLGSTGGGGANSSLGGSSGGQSGGGDSGGSGGGDSGGGQGGQSGGQDKPKNLDNQAKIAVIKQGKFIRELTPNEINILSIIHPYARHCFIVVNDVNAVEFKNAKVVFEVFSKGLKKDILFNNGVPVYRINLELLVKVDEIQADEYIQASIEEITSMLYEQMKEKAKYKLQSDLSELVENCRKDKTDIFGVWDNFYRLHTKEWRKYLKELEKDDDYLNKIVFELDVTFKNKV